MKNNFQTNFLFLIAMLTAIVSCKKFSPETLPMAPITIGAPDLFESLEENSTLSIPIKFTTTCDSGIDRALYKVVNNRASNANVAVLVQGPAMPISFKDKIIDTTISVPIRTGLLSVVVMVFDKAGRMSSKSINIKNVNPSKAGTKTLTDLVMSTDPADNQNFLRIYEPSPVSGSNVASSAQSRVDLLLVNMSGARFIAPNAYGASSAYYNAAKPALTGFSTLTYTFLSSSRNFVNKPNLDKIATDEDLTKFMNDSVIAVTPLGGANYNLINADRRVSDVYGVSNTARGFLIGWGYRSHPNATAAILNEAFGLVLVKSVTQKANGHYVVTFDVKAPSKDQRADYNATTIVPYAPYPL